MSRSAVKSREAKNAATALKLSINEQALADVRAAYTKSPENIISISQYLAAELEKELKNEGKKKSELKKTLESELQTLKKFLAPPERVTVLLIGNHSAGKSSLVNWYVGEHILKTSEAVETTGVTFVRRGTQRNSFKAAFVVELYPHLADVFALPGFKEKVSCEISTSNEKHFPLVDFIDTPGLTDGHLEYAFDIDSVISHLADHADMVCIFLDPHKQALCHHTMNVVKRLSEENSSKMKFYLTRSDLLKTEQERLEVITQITQEVVQHLKVTHGFKMQTIYLPEHKTATSPPNQIDELCLDIQKEIDSSIQKHLEKWKGDCKLLNDVVSTLSARDRSRVTGLWKARLFKLISLLALLGLGALAVVSFFTRTKDLSWCAQNFGYGCEFIHTADANTLIYIGVAGLLAILIVYFTQTRSPHTLSAATKKRFAAITAFTDNELKKQDETVKSFVQQSL